MRKYLCFSFALMVSCLTALNAAEDIFKYKIMVGNSTNETLSFGLAEASEDGYDAMDLPFPPSVPVFSGGNVPGINYFYFRGTEEPGVDYPRKDDKVLDDFQCLATDMRESGNSTSTWTLVVESLASSAGFTMKWAKESGKIQNGGKLLLCKEDGTQMADMLSVSQYDFKQTGTYLVRYFSNGAAADEAAPATPAPITRNEVFYAGKKVSLCLLTAEEREMYIAGDFTLVYYKDGAIVTPETRASVEFSYEDGVVSFTPDVFDYDEFKLFYTLRNSGSLISGTSKGVALFRSSDTPIVKLEQIAGNKVEVDAEKSTIRFSYIDDNKSSYGEGQITYTAEFPTALLGNTADFSVTLPFWKYEESSTLGLCGVDLLNAIPYVYEILCIDAEGTESTLTLIPAHVPSEPVEGDKVVTTVTGSFSVSKNIYTLKVKFTPKGNAKGGELLAALTYGENIYTPQSVKALLEGDGDFDIDGNGALNSIDIRLFSNFLKAYDAAYEDDGLDFGALNWNGIVYRKLSNISEAQRAKSRETLTNLCLSEHLDLDGSGSVNSRDSLLMSNFIKAVDSAMDDDVFDEGQFVEALVFKKLPVYTNKKEIIERLMKFLPSSLDVKK